MIDEIGEYKRIRGMLMTLQPCKVKGVPIQEKSYWISATGGADYENHGGKACGVFISAHTKPKSKTLIMQHFTMHTFYYSWDFLLSSPGEPSRKSVHQTVL